MRSQGTANAYVLFSRDDGRSWGEAVKVAPRDYNETALLRLRSDRWLAASPKSRRRPSGALCLGGRGKTLGQVRTLDASPGIIRLT